NSVEMKLLGSRGGIVVVTIPQKSKRKLFDDLVGNLQVLVNAIDTKNVNDGLNKVFSKAQADIESVIDRFKKAAESFKNPVE
ncbi:hypothetical protein KAR91_29365, partial [Candidatus Pacearchaeota archaeon]|nr:hypothetical protein [Candidatus Pacearchaeota archaeon]